MTLFEKEERVRFRAVLVGDRRNCVVLWPQGECLKEMVRDSGSEADNLGFEMVEGIKIWEGTMLGGEYDSYNGDYGDVYPSGGTLRAPTEEELRNIAAGKCPWPEERPEEPIVREVLAASDLRSAVEVMLDPPGFVKIPAADVYQAPRLDGEPAVSGAALAETWGSAVDAIVRPPRFPVFPSGKK